MHTVIKENIINLFPAREASIFIDGVMASPAAQHPSSMTAQIFLADEMHQARDKIHEIANGLLASASINPEITPILRRCAMDLLNIAEGDLAKACSMGEVL